MPMIDIYATTGTFQNVHQLAMGAAAVLKSVEGVPDLDLFRKTTADFVHELQHRWRYGLRAHPGYNTGALTRRDRLPWFAN
jgi:hypothetical protein